MKLTDTFTIKDLIDDKLSYLDIVGKLHQDELKQLVDHKSAFIREEIARIIDVQYLYLMENDENEYIRKLVCDRILDEGKRKKFSNQDIEKAFGVGYGSIDFFSDLRKSLYTDYIYNADALIATTLKDLTNQGQTGSQQMQFKFAGSSIAKSVTWPPAFNWAGMVASGPSTTIGPVNTLSWAATGMCYIPPKTDSVQVEKIQLKVSGPLSCSSCNEINEYAEPNQKDGTYICYNCK